MPFYSIAICNSVVAYGGPEFYLLTTPDCQTADLFYRFLQTYPQTSHMCRFTYFETLSAQMWRFVASRPQGLPDVVTGLSAGQISINDNRFKSLIGRVILHRYSAPHSPFDTAHIPPAIIPHLDRPAHISGGEFYIRDKFDHKLFWTTSGKFITARTANQEPTKFRIELADNAIRANTTGTPLMIESDGVRITAFHGFDQVTSLGPVSHRSMGDGEGLMTLEASQHEPTVFQFGAFNSGFYLDRTSAMTYDPTCVHGQQWELVA
ncbi:hypothetical protein BDV10DRAFT_187106 [Aspergillus recurvatus]